MSRDEIERRAQELARAIQSYSNTTGEELDLAVTYYGCRELGWVCRIEVK